MLVTRLTCHDIAHEAREDATSSAHSWDGGRGGLSSCMQEAAWCCNGAVPSTCKLRQGAVNPPRAGGGADCWGLLLPNQPPDDGAPVCEDEDAGRGLEAAA